MSTAKPQSRFAAPILFAAVLAAQASLGACATAQEASAPAEGDVRERPVPAWFASEVAEGDAQGFPNLAEMPAAPTAKLDPNYWAALQADLAAARQALEAAPRAAPAPAGEDPAAFQARAREGLDETSGRY